MRDGIISERQLIGVGEFAEILGISYQAVQNRLQAAKTPYSNSLYSRRRPKVPFPMPVQYNGIKETCPRWLRAQAVAYRDAVEEKNND